MFTVNQIKDLIKQNRIIDFYNDWTWRKLAAEVKREQNNECQICKSRGKYSRAEIVHHVKELKKRPDLAYSRTYTDSDGSVKIQLMALCQSCHEEQHPDRFHKIRRNSFRNKERW